jgi:DNA ligase (NAD+)
MVQRWVATLGIKNFGENLLTRLVEMGRVQEINDLYTLTKSELASLDRMGDSSSEKVLRNLHAVSEVTLPQFIAGFDIEGIGESTIEKAEEAGLDSLDKLRNAKIDELQQVSGIGPETAQVLYNGLRAKYSQMDQLLCHTPLKIKGKIQGGKLTGQSFCFTGELHSMKRSSAEEMVKSLGGSISSVKKGLTALVTNDPNSGSEKNKKAQSLGIKIISEDDFLEMVK